MKRLENLTNDSFVKSLELNLKKNSKYFFYLQSWQDGDAFLDVCDDDTGKVMNVGRLQNDVFKEKK